MDDGLSVYYVNRSVVLAGPINHPYDRGTGIVNAVSNQIGCWPISHQTIKRLEAFKKSKTLRQFTVSLDDGYSDEED